jgi:hypothetical protein
MTDVPVQNTEMLFEAILEYPPGSDPKVDDAARVRIYVNGELYGYFMHWPEGIVTGWLLALDALGVRYYYSIETIVEEEE